MTTQEIIDIESIKKDILYFAQNDKDVMAIGLCGSLARGDYNERSDIDIFVVIPDDKYHPKSFVEWYLKISKALTSKRKCTVFVYTPKILRKIPCWATLDMASDNILVYDKANISEIFKKMIKKAEEAGLVRVKYCRYPVWSAKLPIDPGTIIKVELDEDE